MRRRRWFLKDRSHPWRAYFWVSVARYNASATVSERASVMVAGSLWRRSASKRRARTMWANESIRLNERGLIVPLVIAPFPEGESATARGAIVFFFLFHYVIQNLMNCAAIPTYFVHKRTQVFIIFKTIFP